MQRRIIALLVLILTLAIISDLSAVTPVSAAPFSVENVRWQQSFGTAVIRVAKLNVRRAPRTTAVVIGTLRINDVVNLVGRDRLAEWLQVDTPFGLGWVHYRYISTSVDVLTLPLTTILPHLIVIANPFANVRSGPFRGYPVIAEAPYESDLDIIGRHSNGTMFQVLLGDGRIGWIDAELSQVFGDLTDTPFTDRTVLPLAEIDAYRVRVRTAPNASARIVATVGLNQQFSIIGQTATGTYYLIKGSFGTGYILANYVRVIGYKSAIPVVR